MPKKIKKIKKVKTFKSAVDWFNHQVKTKAIGYEHEEPIKKELPLPDNPDDRAAIFSDHSARNVCLYGLREFLWCKGDIWMVPKDSPEYIAFCDKRDAEKAANEDAKKTAGRDAHRKMMDDLKPLGGL